MMIDIDLGFGELDGEWRALALSSLGLAAAQASRADSLCVIQYAQHTQNLTRLDCDRRC
jgi:hypothetical protein